MSGEQTLLLTLKLMDEYPVEQAAEIARRTRSNMNDGMTFAEAFEEAQNWNSVEIGLADQLEEIETVAA